MKMRHVVESPIEVMLLAELYRRQELREVVTGSGSDLAVGEGPRLSLATQVDVSTDAGDFRLDIVVEALGFRVGVECDGAAFHGSQDQADRDHARDEALRRSGWTVVRFTGAEIYRDAAACADEIRRCLWFMAGRPRARKTGDGPAWVPVSDPGQGAARRPWRTSSSEAHADRFRVALPGAAVDALGLLVAFPELAPIAEEEHLPGLLPDGPFAELARDLLREPTGLEAALARLARLAPAVDEAALSRIRALSGPGRPEAAAAAGQLRRACVKASIELLVAEQDRLYAEIARRGSPVPDDLLVRAQNRARIRGDLEQRLRSEGMDS